jgi:tetratricopeptide (TPR) repeat protein
MRRSFALASAAALREPGNADAQFELATSEFWIGDVSRLRGDLPGALEHYAKYLAICESLAKANPSNSEYAIESGYGHSNVGTILEQQGDLTGALDHYKRALAIKERRNPDKGDLATTVNKVAVISHTMGHYGEARTAFGREHDLLVAALRTRPDNTKWLTALATNRNLLAALEDDSGNDRVALALVEEQHDITAQLVARDPENTLWQRNLAASDAVWARTLRLSGDIDRSLVHYRAALAQLQPLLAKDPTRALWKRDAIFVHSGLAWLALLRHDPGAAREIAEARSLQQTLTANDAVTQRVKWELAIAAGAVAERDGDPGTARREWTSVTDALWPEREHRENRKRILFGRALLHLDRIADAAPVVNELIKSGYRNPELIALWNEKK